MTQHGVLVVAASALLRDSVKLGLKRTQFAVVGDGKTLSDALERSDTAVVADVVIAVVLNAGELDSVLEEIRVGRAAFPHAKSVIIADRLSSADVLKTLRLGVDAILSLNASFSMVSNALALVMMEQRIFPTLPAHLLVSWNDPLTDQPNPIVRDVDSDEPRAPTQTKSNLVPFSPRLEASRNDASVVPSRFPIKPGGADGALRPLVLSDREEEILRCLVNGQSNKVIARELGIAETTVKVHVRSVLRKLRASNRTQAAIWAVNKLSM